ncbi:hypothetical protein LPB136_05120 [Tenacibaculum todarodis]|uniref:Lipocalin-like domain-containing protein n=1 Tax=Tenacibaculum todarodis TaxID=1850252 RepID=A0A1L3JI13_9FLAO|nr:hypothetical protein [Tenacibaculum todarodis]APG64780.1 hypothetical protein LPB136_05120 [Tenacibaculum todarodis]
MIKVILILFLFIANFSFSQVDEKLYVNWQIENIDEKLMKFVKYDQDKLDGTLTFEKNGVYQFNLNICRLNKKNLNIGYWKIKNNTTLILSEEKDFIDFKEWSIKKITDKKLHLKLIFN